MMRSVVLAPALQRVVKRVIAARGERGAADAFDLSSISLLRAVAGLAVSRGTVALIEQALEEGAEVDLPRVADADQDFEDGDPEHDEDEADDEDEEADDDE